MEDIIDENLLSWVRKQTSIPHQIVLVWDLNDMTTSRKKDKERILKASREIQLVIYKGIPIKQLVVSVCLFVSWQKLCRSKGGYNIFKVMKGKMG